MRTLILLFVGVSFIQVVKAQSPGIKLIKPKDFRVELNTNKQAMPLSKSYLFNKKPVGNIRTQEAIVGSRRIYRMKPDGMACIVTDPTNIDPKMLKPVTGRIPSMPNLYR